MWNHFRQETSSLLGAKNEAVALMPCATLPVPEQRFAPVWSAGSPAQSQQSPLPAEPPPPPTPSSFVQLGLKILSKSVKSDLPWHCVHSSAFLAQALKWEQRCAAPQPLHKAAWPLLVVLNVHRDQEQRRFKNSVEDEKSSCGCGAT